jgi:hypothetical protein
MWPAPSILARRTSRKTRLQAVEDLSDHRRRRPPSSSRTGQAHLPAAAAARRRIFMQRRALRRDHPHLAGHARRLGRGQPVEILTRSPDRQEDTRRTARVARRRSSGPSGPASRHWRASFRSIRRRREKNRLDQRQGATRSGRLDGHAQGHRRAETVADQMDRPLRQVRARAPSPDRGNRASGRPAGPCPCPTMSGATR